MVISWLVLFKICFIQIHISSLYGRDDIASYAARIKIGDTYTNCEENWFSFGSRCYKVAEETNLEKLNWEDAQKYCEEQYNGSLVTIYSRKIQDFLTVFLVLNAQSNVWIGLHDRHNESNYEWIDGTPVKFTNYEPNEPSGRLLKEEDCFEMVFKSRRPVYGRSGQWNDIKCNIPNKFICQKTKGIPGSRAKVLDPRYCKTEQGTGWRFDKSCFHLINERKTWAEAEDFCAKSYKGHLATIDFRVNEFLKYVFGSLSKQMWIGIKIKEDPQQKWSSGWLVSFENWGKEKEFVDGTCVFLKPDGTWKMQLCQNKLPFICEYSTVSPPPVLKPTVEGAHCPDKAKGWRDLGGEFCYFFDLDANLDWNKANFQCLRRGGTLASIHSQEESDVLFPFFRHYYGLQPHIGFYRMKDDEEFVWVDGSKVDFTAWDSGEPSTAGEQCAELRTDCMKWNDRFCSALTGYICSVPKVPSNITKAETSPQSSCKSSISISSLLGVIACVLVFSLLIGLVLYHFKVCDSGYERVRKLSVTSQQKALDEEKKARYRSEMIVTDDPDYDNVP